MASAAHKVAFVGAALVAAALYDYVLRLLAAASEVKDFSAAQIGVALAYGCVLAVWAGAEAAHLAHRLSPRAPVSTTEPVESADEEVALDYESPGEGNGLVRSKRRAEVAELSLWGIRREHLPALRASAEFVGIMGYMYLCDRTNIFPRGPKQLSKPSFWAVCAALLLLGLGTLRDAGAEASVRPVDHACPAGGPRAPSRATLPFPTLAPPLPTQATKPLQRDQTEEWKGWMQLMFVLYHYFAEAEIYNAIRVYIAAYVWMTGFGNFSYYYVRADFTLRRFMQMMWRLNFFVFFVCATLKNEYMLYYICAMHTFFTWLVFFTCYAWHHLNSNQLFSAAKIGAALAVAALLYDVPGVFNVVMGPLRPLLAFHDPLHPEFTDELHEWFFRSGLDHLVWVFGMLCAFSFPYADAALNRLEAMPTPQRLLARAAIGLGALGLGTYWFRTYFMLPKRPYNAVHPFTSWVPILCFIVLRNLTPTLRRWHMASFAWTGKVRYPPTTPKPTPRCHMPTRGGAWDAHPPLPRPKSCAKLA